MVGHLADQMVGLKADQWGLSVHYSVVRLADPLAVHLAGAKVDLLVGSMADLKVPEKADLTVDPWVGLKADWKAGRWGSSVH